MKERFPIVVLPPGARDLSEPMGTKEKFWFEHSDGNRWLFKFNRTGHGDDWSEKIASEIAELLGLPHANTELAAFERRPGIMSRDFTRRKDLSLVHGNELLVMLVDPQYPKGQNYKVTEHTVERVRSILEQPWIIPPDGFMSMRGVSTAWDVFTGYLLLDALVGNTDRHHENWAIVVPTHDAGGAVARREVRLAPTFDHASCLGFNLTDRERLDRLTPGRNRTLEGFADRASSKLYLDIGQSKPLSLLSAFIEATRKSLSVRQAWIEKVGCLTDESLVEVIGRIPAERISTPARDFAYALLKLNKTRIIGLTNP